MSSTTVQAAVDFIQQHAPDFTPELALLLGSGLGGATNDVQVVAQIDYQDIPGFPKPTVSGHSGQLILGYLAKLPVMVLQGRAHFYEHQDYAAIKQYIRTVKGLGCRDLLITGASGSLNDQITPGDLLLIADHINLQLPNPLLGANDETIGPRFPDLTFAYHPDFRQSLMTCAQSAQFPLPEGIYLVTSGPTYETAAEIRAFRLLGADAVGMSIVPEVILANHCGLRVAAIACITNFATGLTATRHEHSHVLAIADRCAQQLSQLLMSYVRHHDR
jgi:purine-nucleoside phosphorylase